MVGKVSRQSSAGRVLSLQPGRVFSQRESSVFSQNSVQQEQQVSSTNTAAVRLLTVDSRLKVDDEVVNLHRP
jgi:hypothetical protein